MRSIAAVFAGAAAVVALSTGTDLVLEHTLLPQMNTPAVTPSMLALALAYRTLYGGWLTAKLAPRRELAHALALGAIGTLVAGVGVYAAWGFGQHWYPIALTVLALPQSWVGGRLAVGKAAVGAEKKGPAL